MNKIWESIMGIFKKQDNSNNTDVKSKQKKPKTGFVAIITTQYLLTLASALVAMVFWIIDTNSEAGIKLATQIFIALSSNCCSVACTLSFINRNDEYDSFQPSRTIIIVLSLVINIILTLVFQYGLLQIQKSQEAKLLVLMGGITILLAIMLIRLQLQVESTNTTTVKAFINNPDLQSKIDKSRELTTEVVNGENYNVGN